VRLAEAGGSSFQPLYPDSMTLWEKVRTIAITLYGAAEVTADKPVQQRFDELQAAGFGHLPVCMAKTQYSFSTDPRRVGAPSGHVVDVREVRLSAGAGFVVVITGDIMTMPGLPRVPAANSIRLNAQGLVEGLF
jgi:formate--tetrahydrofolate ligase